jgi:hypothetical protein
MNFRMVVFSKPSFPFILHLLCVSCNIKSYFNLIIQNLVSAMEIGIKVV